MPRLQQGADGGNENRNISLLELVWPGQANGSPYCLPISRIGHDLAVVYMAKGLNKPLMIYNYVRNNVCSHRSII